MSFSARQDADQMVTIEQGADKGWAVRRNGTILLRTASDTEWQAMGNGLVLVFDIRACFVDFADPDLIRDAWAERVAKSVEEIKIVRCQGVEIP